MLRIEDRLEAAGRTRENARSCIRAIVPSLATSHQSLANSLTPLLRPPAYSLQPTASRLRRDRRGVTLLELLIVIMILLMVTAAAIPIMAPALENRRMREAARLASSFVSGARAKAIQSRREVGVVLHRFEGRPYAVSMSYVEVPPPYGGDVTGATCTVMEVNAADVVDPVSPPTGLYVTKWFELDVGTMNTNLVRMHDEIQFNYQGPKLRILGPDANTDNVVDAGSTIYAALLSPTPGAVIPTPWPSMAPSSPVSYQIFRQPVRTSDQPLQLPDGIVIDLLQSGIGLNNAVAFGALGVDPIITFTPNGSVGHVITTQAQRVTSPIFLLMGRRELMDDVATINGGGTFEDKNFTDSDTNPNNLYLQNFWITIGSQTGLVTTSEMATNPSPGIFADARAIAVTSQSIGGR